MISAGDTIHGDREHRRRILRLFLEMLSLMFLKDIMLRFLENDWECGYTTLERGQHGVCCDSVIRKWIPVNTERVVFPF